MPQDIGGTFRRRALYVLAVLLAAALSAMGIETEFEGGDWPIIGRRERSKPSAVDKPGVADPYAEQHRLLPEEPKGPSERGTYLHPELYAQPATARVRYQPEHEINATGHQTA